MQLTNTQQHEIAKDCEMEMSLRLVCGYEVELETNLRGV